MKVGQFLAPFWMTLTVSGLACTAAPAAQGADAAGGGQTDTAVGAADSADAAPADAVLADGAVADAVLDTSADAVKDAGADGSVADAPAPDVAAPETQAETQTDTQADVQADATATPDSTVTCSAGSFLPMNETVCKEATCANMAAAVAAALNAATVQAAAGCTADEQCTAVSTTTACQGTCGAVVKKDAAAAMASTVAWLDANICKPQGYAGKCGYGTPSCKGPVPGCVAGKCVFDKPATLACPQPQPPNTVCLGNAWACQGGYFKGYASTDCIEATCENLAKAKNEAIAAAIAKSQACSGSDDCVHIATSTDCGGTCGASVNAGMQNDVLKVVGWVDDNLCKAFGFKTKCGYSTPKCKAPEPTCGKGVCWDSPTGP